jgi:hypothetical protein
MWLFLAQHLTCAIGARFNAMMTGEKKAKLVGAENTAMRFGSMQCGFRIIIPPPPLDDLEAALEARESALIKV